MPAKKTTDKHHQEQAKAKSGASLPKELDEADEAFAQSLDIARRNAETAQQRTNTFPPVADSFSLDNGNKLKGRE